MICKKCHAVNDDAAQFCESCGAPLQPTPTKDKLKIVLLLGALFCMFLSVLSLDMMKLTSLAERYATTYDALCFHMYDEEDWSVVESRIPYYDGHNMGSVICCANKHDDILSYVRDIPALEIIQFCFYSALVILSIIIVVSWILFFVYKKQKKTIEILFPIIISCLWCIEVFVMFISEKYYTGWCDWVAYPFYLTAVAIFAATLIVLFYILSLLKRKTEL
ncbi:MAG: zinc-ribbon domain-containing protein [Paludibacteraceae bacterium]